ncbi:MAG: AmmeMemoRadiSam system protein B [Gemmataceae bacterium]|nr:AmmeMemoRadiSam system protein B [Gemmataceae bacterium]MDW8264923.1 AmmeMemoRadiSam system protein B [Gemmataceae bacterium]
MIAIERPKLRSGLVVDTDPADPGCVLLTDPYRIAPSPQRLTHRELSWVRLFDGQRTLRDVQYDAIRQARGELLPIELFADLARRLDEHLFLEGPAFRQVADHPIRPPSCLGCYPEEPEELRQYLEAMLGRPAESARGGCGPGRLRAALVPHIDYRRGRDTYHHAYQYVADHAGVGLYVIIGTAHYSAHRFTLTRKHFQTPLGVVPTDEAFIDRLVSHYGPGLFDDELAHLPEHSIELEVVILQYLHGPARPFRIVPLIVGSFHDCIQQCVPPREMPDIARMIDALRRAEAATAEPVCYLISGDMAHIGPKFGDPEPVDRRDLDRCRHQDQNLLQWAAAGNTTEYFRLLMDERDRRRICGFPPTYTLLEAIGPARGQVVHYNQYVHSRGFECVSFAAVSFDRD